MGKCEKRVEGPHTAGGCEGSIDVEETDGVLDWAVFEGRDNGSCFGHRGAVLLKCGLY